MCAAAMSLSSYGKGDTRCKGDTPEPCLTLCWWHSCSVGNPVESPKAPAACTYGPYGAFGPCSALCTTTGELLEGVSVSFQPLVVQPPGVECVEINARLKYKECSTSVPCTSCDNLLLDQGEVDIDCGGSCAPCSLGRVCVAPYDCDLDADLTCDGDGGSGLCNPVRPNPLPTLWRRERGVYYLHLSCAVACLQNSWA